MMADKESSKETFVPIYDSIRRQNNVFNHGNDNQTV